MSDQSDYDRDKVSTLDAIKGEIKRRLNDVISSPVKGVREHGTGQMIQNRKARNKAALDDA